MTNNFQPLLDLAAKADPVFDTMRDSMLEQSLSSDNPLTFEEIERMIIGVTSKNTNTGIDKKGFLMTRQKSFEMTRYGFSKENRMDYEGLEVYTTPNGNGIISAAYSSSLYMFMPIPIGSGFLTNIMLVPANIFIKTAVCYPYSVFIDMQKSVEAQAIENPFLQAHLITYKRLSEKSQMFPPERAYEILMTNAKKLAEEFNGFLNSR